MDSFLSKPFLLGKSRGASGAFALQRRLGSPQGLFLDFTDDSSLIIDGAVPANNYRGKAFDKLTFTRASTATRFNSAGQIETVASGASRIDYDPVTRVARGLLIEGARTNLVLNSDTLSTQSVTVTAAVHTLSFYGTGTVTLSGASTAGPLTGSGAFPTRSSLVFTPSAGTLTLTVSGSVTFAQLELGAIPSSYIPTAGVTVTRAAEFCSIAQSLFPALSGAYTIFVSGVQPDLGSDNLGHIYAGVGDGSYNNYAYFIRALGQPIYFQSGSGGVQTVNLTVGNTSYGTPFKVCGRVKTNDAIAALNGTLATLDTSATLPASIASAFIGMGPDGASNRLFGWVRSFAVLPTALTDAQLQAVTA